MAWLRRAEADEIAAAQLVERAQEMALIGEPALVFSDHCCPIAVGANAKGIPPFRATTDVDGARRHACEMFVDNPAHEYRLSIFRCGRLFAGRGSGTRVTNRVPRWGNGLPVDPRAAASNTSPTDAVIAVRDAAGSADAAGLTDASSAAACTNSLNPGRARQREPLPPWRSLAVRAQARRRGQASRCRLGSREP